MVHILQSKNLKSTYRALVLNAVSPEIGSGELGPQHRRDAVHQSRASAHHAARSVVQRQRVVNAVRGLQTQHVHCGHHDEKVPG